MDRTIVTKQTFAEADDHVTIYNDKTPLERLNHACELIYSIYQTDQHQKVDRTITSARKHDKKG